MTKYLRCAKVQADEERGRLACLDRLLHDVPGKDVPLQVLLGNENLVWWIVRRLQKGTGRGMDDLFQSKRQAKLYQSCFFVITSHVVAAVSAPASL